MQQLVAKQTLMPLEETRPGHHPDHHMGAHPGHHADFEEGSEATGGAHAHAGLHVSTPAASGQEGTQLVVSQDQQREVDRFLLPYRCAIREVLTKVEILREEFATLHRTNPIEHVASRVKALPSIVAKDAARGGDLSAASIHQRVKDIAGIRVTCGFIEDVYRLKTMLAQQPDLQVCEVKDYIAAPKHSGYRSLHLMVTVPVFLSASVMHVPVEIQLRTVAMDFWASLEHKMHYKFVDEVPATVSAALCQAAHSAHDLDVLMQDLHQQVSLSAGAAAALER